MQKQHLAYKTLQSENESLKDELQRVQTQVNTTVLDLNAKLETKDKYAKYKEVAKQVKFDYPSWSKPAIASEMFIRLKQIDIRYVEKKNGELISEASLIKHFDASKK